VREPGGEPWAGSANLSMRNRPQVTVRSQVQWRSKFFHLAMRRGRKIAKIAMARKLAVHLYWMWRQGWDYAQFEKLGSHAGGPGNRHGVQ
jgi:transposase